MAIIQQSSGSFTAATSFSISLPTATTTGNRLVLFIMGTVTFAAPTGWTLRASQVNWMGHYLFDRPAGAGGNTFTAGAAGDGLWYAAEVSGTFDGALGENNTADAATYTTSSLTPTAGGRTLFASIGSIEPGTVRTVDGWTGGFIEQSDAYVERAGGDWPSGAVATQEVTATGSTAYATTTTFSLASGGRSALIAAYTSAASGAANVTAVVAGLSLAALAPDVYEEQIVSGGTTPGFILAAPSPIVSASGAPQAVAFSGSGTLGFAASPSGSGAIGFGGSGTLTGIRTGTLTGSVAFSGAGTLTTSAIPRHAQPGTFSGSGTLAAVSVPSLSFVSAGAGASTSNTNLLVDPPASYAAGDLLVMFVSYRGTLRDTAVPPGWTQLAPWDGQHRVMGKIAAATEAAVAIDLTGVGTTSQGETHQGMMGAFRSSVGWFSLDSVVDSFATGTGSAQDIATPPVNVLTAGSLVLAFGFRHDDWISSVTPTGFTKIGEVTTTLGNDSGLVWAYRIRNADQDPLADTFTITGGVPSTFFSAIAAISVGIVSQTAVLSGQGSLAVSGVPGATSPMDLLGDGTLAVSGVARAADTVTLTGSGALTFTSMLATTAAAVLSGSGSLSSAGKPSSSGAIGLTGSGTFTAAGASTAVGSAGFTGSGAVIFAGSPRPAAALGFTGAGALTGSATPAASFTAGFSGAGNLFLGSAAGYGSTIFLTGAGTLTGQGSAQHGGAAGLSGSGTLTTSASSAVTSLVGFTGSGALGFTGRVLSSADFFGSGQINAAGGLGAIGVAALTGSGALTLSGREGYTGAATFTGNGQLGLFPVRVVAVALSGSGTLSLTGGPGGIGTLARSGVGTLTAVSALSRITGALAYFTSAGEIQCFQERLLVRGAVTFSSSGSLVGTVLNLQYDMTVVRAQLTARKLTARLTGR